MIQNSAKSTGAGWFKITAKEGQPTEIIIYDQIGKDFFGGDGISAKEFAEALSEISPKQRITVCINSPGGNVWDGLTIYNQLKQRREYVTCRVDGVAASIASIIALAGSRLEMPANSMLMIHECSGLAVGGSKEMLAMAEKLDQHSDLLAGIYAEKTGKSREKMRALMRDETWFNGTEARESGFSDVTTGEVQIAASFDLSAFRRVPTVLNKTTNPPPTAVGQHTAKDSKMNKTAIFALLKQHGKPLAEDATDEQILAALGELVTNGKVTNDAADKLKVKEAPILINQSEFREMQARLKEERERRITQEFEVLAMDRPYLSREEWLPKLHAAADDALMATLRGMPVIPSGERPVTVRNNGNTLIEDYRKIAPGKERQEFALKNWHQLENAHASERIQAMSSLPIQEQIRRLHSPQANTYNASLVTDRLADGFITTIGTKLAALRGFSRDFGVDRLKPRATVQVPKATVAATTQTNPTNFESGDSTTTAVSVSVAQLSQDFNVTNDELAKGHQLVTVAAKNAQAFANAISDIWTALITVANYGAATQIGTAATFDAADLAPIYALAKNYGQKNLILDGGHLAYLLPTDKFKFRLGEEGAYNFDLIAEQNRWTNATANTVGFVCDPGAIAVCSGLPVSLPSGEFIELGTVSIESLGLTVQMCHWFSRGGRVHWMSYDVMFGAAAGDITAGEVLVTS